MTDVMIAEVDTDAVAKREPARPVVDGVDSELVDRLVEQARTAGLQLTGDGGLLQQLTKRVMESALDGGYLMYEGTRTTAITGVIESGDNVAISPLV